MSDVIHVRPDKDAEGNPTGGYHWTRVAPNGKTVASNTGFDDVASAEEAAAREAEGTDATIKVDE